LPGEILANKYQVERVIGHGGMGVVVAARHLELDQPVAIKFLVGDAPPTARERFNREAKAAVAVRSEHVCRVFDVGKLESGEPYIVMEYLEGCDLADKLTQEGPQPVAVAVGWLVEACDALYSAHSQGIVHRDLKPANLFLQQSSDGAETIKVVDFGISKLPASGARALTSTAVMMGSPFYMSPEQLESSRDVDARSDIWSLGVVLYELLTGRPPFDGETLVQLAVQTREQEPAAPSTLRPDLPKEIDAVIARCMQKRAADRYSSVIQVVSDLAAFAPPESSALVSKLMKRSTGGHRRSDPKIVTADDIALSPTVAAGVSKDSIDGSVTTPKPVLPKRRTKVFAVVVLGVLGFAGIAFGVTRRAPPAPVAVTSAPVSAIASSPPVVVEPANPVATPATAVAPSASIATAIVAAPSPVQAHAKPRGAVSVAPFVTPSASTTPSPTASTKKRHDLDRDYVP
jgi:serine/threonine-protein kinase